MIIFIVDKISYAEPATATCFEKGILFEKYTWQVIGQTICLLWSTG